MSIYSLIEYSSHYSKTTESLWFYTKDEATNFNADIANGNNFESFMYKAELLKNTVAEGNNEILKDATIAAPSKYLSNFWRLLEVPLINWKVELNLKWTRFCALSAADPDVNNNDGNIIFTIKVTIKSFLL